jgi:uncharacterized SAM-binding protein YcdF (DUF218 family)
MNRIIGDITDFLFVSDPPAQADIIFIPGGSFPELPEKSASLYRQGYAPLLLPSGGTGYQSDKFKGPKSKKDIYNSDYMTECAFFTDVLLKNDVPREAVLMEDKAAYTIENAALSRKLTDEKGLVIKKALIVCKSFHARRCLMLYQISFPEAELLICPVDTYGITRDSWHTFDYGIDRVLGELARCGSQFTGLFKAYLGYPPQQHD